MLSTYRLVSMDYGNYNTKPEKLGEIVVNGMLFVANCKIVLL